ncbi:MAG: hypothetical protein NVSMB25_04650 [Thermoleophilaceae bacterium]
MYPTPERPALGGFVRDQVEALRRLEGIDLELFAFRPRGPAGYASAALELRRRFRAERFDVVHAHYGLTGWSALAVRGAPHVVTFHGTDLEDPRIGALSRALTKLIKLPAPVSATLARRQLSPGRRGAVLPCGVNLERFQPLGRRVARERLGLDPGGRYLLFPADPARPEKRFDLATAVAERVDALLLSYGNAAPDKVPLLVNAASAVLCTSDREGFGLAPLEALACDIPVLATPVGVAPLVLAGVEGTLCAPFDALLWARALAPWLDDAETRVAGRARATLFGSDRFAERVRSAYDGLCGSR